MKLPSKIKIGPHYWQVKRPQVVVSGGDHCRGLCLPEEREIHISKHLKNTRLKETFLHEIIHAIDEEFQMDIGENRVNVLGLLLMQIIQDNKLDFLTTES